MLNYPNRLVRSEVETRCHVLLLVQVTKHILKANNFSLFPICPGVVADLPMENDFFSFIKRKKTLTRLLSI